MLGDPVEKPLGCMAILVVLALFWILVVVLALFLIW